MKNKELAKILIEEIKDGETIHVIIRGNRMQLINLLANLVHDMKSKKVLSEEEIKDVVEEGLRGKEAMKSMIDNKIDKIVEKIFNALINDEDKNKENN